MNDSSSSGERTSTGTFATPAHSSQSLAPPHAPPPPAVGTRQLTERRRRSNTERSARRTRRRGAGQRADEAVDAPKEAPCAPMRQGMAPYEEHDLRRCYDEMREKYVFGEPLRQVWIHRRGCSWLDLTSKSASQEPARHFRLMRLVCLGRGR